MKAWAFLTALAIFVVGLLAAGHMHLLDTGDFSGDMRMLLVAMIAWFVPSPLTGRFGVQTPGAPTGTPTTRVTVESRPPPLPLPDQPLPIAEPGKPPGSMKKGP